MNLKLFAAKRDGGYSGGLIVVAAHDIDEAYKTYTEWATREGKCWVYERYEYEGGEVDEINRYHRDQWYEIPNVSVICENPRVIDEDGYTE